MDRAGGWGRIHRTSLGRGLHGSLRFRSLRGAFAEPRWRRHPDLGQGIRPHQCVGAGVAFLSRCPCHDVPMKSVPFRVPLILILTSGTAGCSAPIACPAIGWSNTATVILQGPVETVDSVEFCADGTCSVTQPKPTTAPKATVTPEASFAPGQAIPGAPAPASQGTPVATSKYGPYFGRKIDDSTWQFSTTMSAPKRAAPLWLQRLSLGSRFPFS